MAIAVELVPSEPLAFEDKLPNPFGGEPFPTYAAFELKEVDKEANQTTITWKQTFVPEEAARIIEATLRALAERVGGPVPEADLLKNFEVRDAAEFVFESSTGWIERSSHIRTTIAGDKSQEDGIFFVRQAERED